MRAPQVNFVIHGLGARLENSKSSWLVTLKTLIVFHRLLREVDPTFQEEVLKYGERTSNRRMLRLEGFADHATKETWDLSAWIRVYSVYLDERLEVFRVFHFDPEQVCKGRPLAAWTLHPLAACEPWSHRPVSITRLTPAAV